MRRLSSLSPRRRGGDHPLGCQIHSSGPLDIAVLDGELDIATAPGLGERLRPLADDGRHILLDVTDLRFCDAAGLSLFLRLAKQVTAAGGSLRLAAPAGPVSRLITTARLDDVLPVTASAAEAIAALADPAGTELPLLHSCRPGP